jgi:hypothetical protein
LRLGHCFGEASSVGLDLIGYLFLEGERHVKELFVVYVLLLSLEIKNVKVVDVFESQRLSVSHRKYIIDEIK